MYNVREVIYLHIKNKIITKNIMTKIYFHVYFITLTEI